MHSLPSISDFTEFLNHNLKAAKNSASLGAKYGGILASSVSSISSLMSSSKGRDKICALIQYFANFYLHCVKYTNISSVRSDYLENKILSFRVAEKIKESMSQGRKIFKFLKFLQQIKAIQKNLKKQKSWAYKMLSISINIMAFFYYLIDNTLWGINIGILSEIVSKNTENRYKKYKNTFSLIKFILKITRNLINLIMRVRKINRIKKQLETCEEKTITVYEDSYDICRVLLKERRKKRFEIIEITISSMRIIMLMKSLKLNIYSSFNPIFVSGCGLGSSIIKIIHAAYCKPKLLKVSKVAAKRISLYEEENNNFFVNRINSEPKSSLLRRNEPSRLRTRTESTRHGIVLDHENASDEDSRKDVGDFFKKPFKHKKKK